MNLGLGPGGPSGTGRSDLELRASSPRKHDPKPEAWGRAWPRGWQGGDPFWRTNSVLPVPPHFPGLGFDTDRALVSDRREKILVKGVRTDRDGGTEVLPPMAPAPGKPGAVLHELSRRTVPGLNAAARAPVVDRESRDADRISRGTELDGAGGRPVWARRTRPPHAEGGTRGSSPSQRSNAAVSVGRGASETPGPNATGVPWDPAHGELHDAGGDPGLDGPSGAAPATRRLKL